MSEIKKKSLQVFVIEEHTEALECMSLSVRRKIMDFSSCDLIHFDSHPDLSCPENIHHRHLFDIKELCHILRNSECGISTFILPSIASGLLNNIVWIKPPWSNQIPYGIYPKMCFGWKTYHNFENTLSRSVNHDTKICESDNKMLMITSLPYWVDDGVSSNEDTELTNCVNFDLSVLDIKDWNYNENLYKNDWILDVCLDYFSCANPLNEPFLPDHVSTAEEIEVLIAIFRTTLLKMSHHPPRFSIIARSEVDGFTPNAVAAKLEASVLAAIEKAFGIIKVHYVKSHDDFYDVNFIRKIY